MNRPARTTTKTVLSLSALAMLVTGAVLYAGPLNPPAGPVTSTGRTLDEIYNRIPAVGASDGRTPISATGIITAPGSYVLTANISVTSGNGLAITADNVTIDLNGFSISSTANTGSGIQVNSNSQRLVVRNGTVSGFGVGVNIASFVDSVILEDLLVRSAKTTGITSTATNTKSVHVRRCTVLDTGATTVAADGNLNIQGIALSGAVNVLEDCVVARLFYNGGGVGTFRGIHLSNASATGVGNLVTGCTVTHDAAITGTGIRFENGGVYRDNTVMLFSTPYTVPSATNGGGNV